MWDIAIIGGGPAGLTAGLYACRAGRNTVLFEAAFPGGQAATTGTIENYPGFPDGVEGSDLAMRMEEQARKAGLVVKYDSVVRVELDGAEKTLHTDGGAVVSARAVLLCMGAQPRTLGLAREDVLRGAGISYCATCDGAFFRGKHVAVVGGGNTAAEDALYLSRIAETVTLIHRRDALRASEVLARRIAATPNICVLWSSVVTELVGETTLTEIETEHLPDGKRERFAVSGLFVAVGTTPQTSLIRGSIEVAEDDGIVTDARMHTSIPGVFAAGDARHTELRQVVTAVADGAMAATQADKYLTEL